jgi:hypothetical protein
VASGFEWFNAADYGFVPNPGSPVDQMVRWNDLMAAVRRAGGGRVRLQPGTYYLANATTHGEFGANPDPHPEIEIHGAGQDRTIITTLAGGAQPSKVLGLTGNGGLFDLTVDGAGYALNGLGGGNESVDKIVSEMTFERVTCRNVFSSPDSHAPQGAVFVVNSATQLTSYAAIHALRLTDVIIEGPSAEWHDGLGISNVTTCTVENLTLRNLTRSPNFYHIDNLVIDGLTVEGSQNAHNEPCLVIERYVNRARIHGLVVARSNGVPPRFESPDCTVTDSQFSTAIVRVGWSRIPLSEIGMRFVRCTIDAEVVVSGTRASGPPKWFELRGCRVAPATPVQACVLFDSREPSIANMSLTGSTFDTTYVLPGAAAISSNYPATMSDSQIADNVVTGGRPLFHSTIIVGPGNAVRGNSLAPRPPG